MSNEADRGLMAKLRKVAQGLPQPCERKAVVKAILAKFPELNPKTVNRYAVVAMLSDYLYDLYMDRKLSFNIVTQLGGSTLDTPTQDFLGQTMLEKKLAHWQLLKIKAFLRRGSSVAEAIAKATGEIPEQPKMADRPVQVENLSDEIMRMGTQWRVKVQMAMDLLPPTVLEGGAARVSIFKKAYELRHIVREQLEFIDKKVEQFLKEVETHAAVEAEVASRRELIRTNGGSYGNGDREEGASPVGSAEPAVQDPAQDA